MGTVLIVEDDEPTRDLLRTALRAAGYSVMSAGDGADALRIVSQQSIAAIVLDLGLPRVSGRDVLRELKSHHATYGIPVVVVSGHDTSDLDGSDVSVLTKPVHAEAVVWQVERSVRRARNRLAFN